MLHGQITSLHYLLVTTRYALNRKTSWQYSVSAKPFHERCVVCTVTVEILEIVIVYTEILTRKVVLWCLFTSEASEKFHNSTFQVKISV